MAQRTSKPAPSPTKASTGFDLWQANPALYGPQVGYLITETVKRQRPIAIVVTPGGHDREGALRLAHNITRGTVDPFASYPKEDEAYVIDLRDNAPLPLCLYGLIVTKVNEQGEPLHNERPREYWPLCRHRLNQVLSAAIP